MRDAVARVAEQRSALPLSPRCENVFTASSYTQRTASWILVKLYAQSHRMPTGSLLTNPAPSLVVLVLRAAPRARHLAIVRLVEALVVAALVLGVARRHFTQVAVGIVIDRARHRLRLEVERLVLGDSTRQVELCDAPSQLRIGEGVQRVVIRIRLRRARTSNRSALAAAAHAAVSQVGAVVRVR